MGFDSENGNTPSRRVRADWHIAEDIYRRCEINRVQLQPIVYEIKIFRLAATTKGRQHLWTNITSNHSYFKLIKNICLKRVFGTQNIRYYLITKKAFVGYI